MREYTEITLNCQHSKCGRQFIATRRDAKYCRPQCRVAAHRDRARPTLLGAMVPRHKHMIERWNTIRSASTYAENMIVEIFNKYGLGAAILAISAGYGVQMNIDTKTELDYLREETL